MNDLINLCCATVFENFTFLLCKLYLVQGFVEPFILYTANQSVSYKKPLYEA